MPDDIRSTIDDLTARKGRAIHVQDDGGWEYDIDPTDKSVIITAAPGRNRGAVGVTLTEGQEYDAIMAKFGGEVHKGVVAAAKAGAEGKLAEGVAAAAKAAPTEPGIGDTGAPLTAPPIKGSMARLEEATGTGAAGSWDAWLAKTRKAWSEQTGASQTGPVG